MYISSACLWSCVLIFQVASGWKDDLYGIENNVNEDAWNEVDEPDNSDRKAPILTLQGVDWWMAVGMKGAKGRPVANLYEVRKKNAQNMINNKNSMHRRFSFGIGKRNDGGVWLQDDDPNMELFEDKRKGEGRYSFGIGKREIPREELLQFQKDIESPKRAGKFSFGLGKRDSGFEDEKRSKAYSFGLGKRFDDGVKRSNKGGMYSFGLGKREIEDDSFDNYYLLDHLENSEDFEKRNRNFNFGLGKRLSNENDEFVPDEDEKRAYTYAFGLGKRGKSYSFGLGKRDRSENMYRFGLGKREEDALEEDKRNKMYGFGLGKRGEEKKSKNYSFGLGKREDAKDSNADDANKRSRQNQYSFGLGKRDTLPDNGSSSAAASNDHALLTHEA